MMDYTSRSLSTGWMMVMLRSIQDGLHKQAIIYRMGGVGEVITGQITQYRTDYPNSPLSTGWVVWERSIQDIIYRMGGVGEVNMGRITQTGYYLQDGW